MKNPEKYYILNKKVIPESLLCTPNNIIENGLWYSADTNDLLKFYKKKKAAEGKQYYTPTFYSLAPTGDINNLGPYSEKNNFTVYHNSMASAVSKAITNLVFSNEPKIVISTGNKVRDKEINGIFTKITSDNKFLSLLQKAGEEVSAYGSGLFTVIVDPDISEFPIIQFYNPEEFFINKKYGSFIISAVLKQFYEKERDSYLLLTEIGYGSIEYKLFKLKSTSPVTIDSEVALSTLPETSDLKNVYFKDGEERFNHILAVYIENKNGGLSDYHCVKDDFQALDETYSNMLNYIRKMKPKKNISENSLKKSEDGTPVIPNEYDTNYTIIWDNSPQNVTTTPTQEDFNLQTSISGYIDSLNNIKYNIASSVGLSPASLGLDNSGANASGEALNIRENISTRTRDERCSKWRDCLVELTRLMISLYSPEYNGEFIEVSDLYNYDVNIEFSDPLKPTLDEVIATNETLLNLGVIDRELAIKRIFVDTGIYSQQFCDDLSTRLRGETKVQEESELEKLKAELQRVSEEDNKEEE